MTPALFNVLGAGFRESCLEDDFGLGTAATIAAESYLRAFERALAARGVPFAYAGGETFEQSTRGAKWIVCATAAGIKGELISRLEASARAGAHVTIGPRVPDRDGSMRRLATAYGAHGLEVEPLDDIAKADTLVARRIEELALPTYPAAPDEIHVTVHADATGAARVVFVMNPTAVEVSARVALPGVAALRDLLDDGAARIARHAGGFDVVTRARTARMFAVD
jgi:beta-galactosidase